MVILLVGGIHGGYEQNTVRLMSELAVYFSRHPDAVAPSSSLYIVPAANPDGMRRGRTLEGRFNANMIDLNRNWGCDWSPEASLGQTPIDPGPAPFSEPETRALRDFIVETEPLVVVWYHSAADGIFPGACEGEDHGSMQMAEVLGAATGYPVGEFDDYALSGTASDWVDSLGIPSMALELAGRETIEFDRNLAGVMALQCHFARLAAPGWNLGDLDDFIGAHCEAGNRDG
jgi:predicted deacylase